MRLLLLDGSQMLHSLVCRLVEDDVEVNSVQSFAEAVELVRREPPDAMIVNLTPSPLPWSELKALCQSHEPPIPVLFESCVHHSASEAGLGDLNHNAHFLEKPFGLDELRHEIERLTRATGAR